MAENMEDILRKAVLIMKPINIYALTRLNNPELISKVEKQMSGRERNIRIRKWETEGLRLFSERLQHVCSDACSLTFYYSYTMQKLGKEFDLLRIADDQLINIELKSGNVSNEAIRKQLIQNRYYLSTLGRPVYYFTFISGQDRLLRLSNSGRLVDATFEELGVLLDNQTEIYTDDIEELFKEDKYLISLTNKIRMNNELSTFLRTFLSASNIHKMEYPNVSVSYGADMTEARNLIRFYEKEGYMFIWDRRLSIDINGIESFPGEALTRIESASVTGKEFDKVLMLLDDSFYYDEERFLRNIESENGSVTSKIMNLFHGLSRARKIIALVIMGNIKLMEQVYHILQK